MHDAAPFSRLLKSEDPCGMDAGHEIVNSNHNSLKSYNFWNTLPSSPVKSTDVSEESVSQLAACFVLICCLAYSSIMKMEEMYSSETSVSFRLTM
jgi:hypothetical protein